MTEDAALHPAATDEPDRDRANANDPRADALEVRRKIREALSRVAPFDADCVVVEAEEGKVVLSGEVGTRYVRDIVEDAAWSVPGVTLVKDNIAIIW